MRTCIIQGHPSVVINRIAPVCDIETALLEYRTPQEKTSCGVWPLCEQDSRPKNCATGTAFPARCNISNGPAWRLRRQVLFTTPTVSLVVLGHEMWATGRDTYQQYRRKSLIVFVERLLSNDIETSLRGYSLRHLPHSLQPASSSCRRSWFCSISGLFRQWRGILLCKSRGKRNSSPFKTEPKRSKNSLQVKG